jgi:hypothetical protein
MDDLGRTVKLDRDFDFGAFDFGPFVFFLPATFIPAFTFCGNSDCFRAGGDRRVPN